jgi:hypothetical protein
VLVHRDWVTKCMGQMTDFNREEVQSELRAIIADAHLNQRLWTTDWAGMQLQRCAHFSLRLICPGVLLNPIFVGIAVA